MENFVSDYILGFCDYLDKTGDYEFADRIMITVANPLRENVRVASKDLYSPEEVLQKLINYRFAEETKSGTSPSIIDAIDKAGKKADKTAARKALWSKFVSSLMKIFPNVASKISLLKNFGGPVITAIFVVPSLFTWVSRIANEGKEALDSAKEYAEFASFVTALGGTISSFAAAASSPTVIGGLSMAAVSGILFAVSAAAYVVSLVLPNNDDPYDNLPADKKPKPQNSSPSAPAAPREKPAPERSRPSEEQSEAPSRPSSRPSRPRTPSVDPKEQRTIDDLREIQKGMGSISF
jgi:hypothetical protein